LPLDCPFFWRLTFPEHMIRVSIGASSAKNLQLETFFGLYPRAGRGRFLEDYVAVSRNLFSK
jgi:hypothetical protein